MTADQAGDEPLLLANRLPGIPILVGASRKTSVRRALERFAVEVIILDDGFQHMSVWRDVDLLLLRGPLPFGNRRLLPRGPLREPLAHLRRGHAFIATDMESGLQGLPEVTGGICREKPVFFFHRRSRYFLAGGERDIYATRSVGPLTAGERPPGGRAYLFCGLANNRAFLESTRDSGITVCGWRFYNDHYVYSPRDMEELVASARAAGAQCLLTSEKDYVKIRCCPTGQLPLYIACIEMCPSGGGEDLIAWLDEKLKRRRTG
jgi:tetraacyldisaccharide 4'-kinase